MYTINYEYGARNIKWNKRNKYNEHVKFKVLVSNNE